MQHQGGAGNTGDQGEFIQAGLEEGLYELEVAFGLPYRASHLGGQSASNVGFTLQLVNVDAAMVRPGRRLKFKKRLNEARAALVASDLAKAKGALAEAAPMGAWDADYLTLAGQVAQLGGDCPGAEKLLTKARAVARGVLRPEGSLALGECWLQAGKGAQAGELWVAMAKSDPRSWSARMQAANQLSVSGQSASALEVCSWAGRRWILPRHPPPGAWPSNSPRPLNGGTWVPALPPRRRSLGRPNNPFFTYVIARLDGRAVRVYNLAARCVWFRGGCIGLIPFLFVLMRFFWKGNIQF